MNDEITIIKNTWEEASKSLNNCWSINMCSDLSKENNSVLVADGLFYSPISDSKRPYPIFNLNFTLKWDGKFTIIIKERIPKNQKLLNKYNYFSEGKQLLLNLGKNSEKYNVSELLNELYNTLFQEFEEREELHDHANYWIEETKILFPSLTTTSE